MTNDFMLLLPLILVTTGAIALMLISAYEKITIEQAALGSMAIFGISFFVQLSNCIVGQVTPYETIFGGMIAVSNFSKVAGLIILGCGFVTSISARSYFKQNSFCTLEFYSLTTFAACGMLLLTIVQELICVFIALEIMSLAIYVLVGYDRKKVTATEAVLKYLMLGAFAGAFFTMGSALIYGGVGSTKFAVIGEFIQSNGMAGSPAIIGGSFFIIIALLFKVATFPFHAWVIDVYDGASLPITGYMATALKTAIFVVFANFIISDSNLHDNWIGYLFYLSIFTMFIGNLIAIGQSSLKRMLAASGIVHTGYLLIGLIAINSVDFTGTVILYYLAAYAVGTLGMFAALSYLSGEGEKRQSFDDFKGLARVKPFSAGAISLFLLSMAGIPPTAGFMGKFFIITSAIDAGQIALAVFGVISSVLSMWYYLRLIINMYFREAEDSFEDVATDKFGPACTFILAICVLAIGIYPIII